MLLSHALSLSILCFDDVYFLYSRSMCSFICVAFFAFVSFGSYVILFAIMAPVTKSWHFPRYLAEFSFILLFPFVVSFFLPSFLQPIALVGSVEGTGGRRRSLDIK